jgi:hypothetical protein
MPIPAWNYKTGSAISVYTNSLPYQDGALISIYGTTASNAVVYNIAQVTNKNIVTNALFTDIIDKVNQERTRRAVTTTSITLNTIINHLDFNAIKDAVTLGSGTTDQAYNDPSSSGFNGYYGYHYVAIPSYFNTYYQHQYFYYRGPYLNTLPPVTTYSSPAVSITAAAAAQYDKITVLNFNKIINDINNAGAVCTCNCNYCTCNCNYCTCNCNYSCTCNCNYSDERVKSNIEYM